ncbi:hypothetical protein [Candidatus Poriferisodalis sp.]|uniref:hypothetical protein n=1 Tax=Candidatus Poriferisodalis sp. TaxID=3101277 RepID=UPI003B011E3F
MKTCRGRAQSALTHHDHGGTVDCHRKSDNSHSHPEPAKPTVKTCSGRGQPSHTHHDHGGTVDCHRKSDAPAGHGHAPITASDPVGDALKRAGSLIATGTTESLNAARDLLEQIATDVKDDAQWTADKARQLNQEINKLYNKTPEPLQAFIEAVASGTGCAVLVKLVATSTVATAGAAAPAWIAAAAKYQTATGVTCGGFYAAAKTAIIGSGDGSSGDGTSGDGTSGNGNGNGDDGKGAKGTRSGRGSGSGNGDGSSSGGDSSGGETQPTPSEGGTAAAQPQPDDESEPESGEVSPGQLAQANRDRIAGRITREQLEAIKNRFRCQLGFSQFCK